MSRHPRRRKAASMVEDNTNSGIHFDEARLCCLQLDGFFSLRNLDRTSTGGNQHEVITPVRQKLTGSDKPGRGSCQRRESERMHEGEVDTTVDAVARERFRVETAEAATDPFPPHFVPLAARRPLVGDGQSACLFKVSKASHAISS